MRWSSPFPQSGRCGPATASFRGVLHRGRLLAAAHSPSTPFRPDGEIDIPSFRRVVDFCIACGAHGLVFPVNASEWTALSDEERFKLDQALVEQNAGRLPVVIGVNAASQESAARFAAHQVHSLAVLSGLVDELHVDGWSALCGGRDVLPDFALRCQARPVDSV